VCPYHPSLHSHTLDSITLSTHRLHPHTKKTKEKNNNTNHPQTSVAKNRIVSLSNAGPYTSSSHAIALAAARAAPK
jgi:hypothetical protein